MYTVLVTGFEPYWNYPENSSWVVAQEVATHDLAGVRICTELMPVSFHRVATAFRRAIDQHTPDLIIMLGQSGGSDRVKLERIAINMMDSKLPDNDGYLPDEEIIYADGSSALFTNTAIKELRTTIEQLGIKVKISNSCGLYVCNRLYYEALLISQRRPSTQALFVHLPYYEGQPSANPAKPTIPLTDMVQAIIAIIRQTSGTHQAV